MIDPLIGTTISFTIPAQRPDEAPKGGLGSQVLPVADLGEDYEGDPEDGMEYLFMVRREAKAQPRVNRVTNPYEAMEMEVEAQEVEEPTSQPSQIWREAFIKRFESLRKRMQLAPPLSSFAPASHPPVPAARDETAWKTFIYGKRSPPQEAKGKEKEVMNPVPETINPAPMNLKALGEMTLEEAKALALASLELDAPEEDASNSSSSSSPHASTINPTVLSPQESKHPPHPPTTRLLLEIEPPSLIHILSHFTTWISEISDAHEEKIAWIPSTIFAPTSVRRKPGAPKVVVKPKVVPVARPKPRRPLPTPEEADWILSLLTALEILLSGDDVATLRDLGKLLSSLAEASGREADKREMANRSQEECILDEVDAEGRAKCWMIVAVIADVWGQKDLWSRNLS